MSALLTLVSGTLWRDPAARQSKSGKQFTTALIKAGTQAESFGSTSFASTAQSELLGLQAGDGVSVQGVAKLSVFEKNGEHRASVEVVAAHVLALRQPPKKREPKQSASALGRAAFDDDFPENFGEGANDALQGMASGRPQGS